MVKRNISKKTAPAKKRAAPKKKAIKRKVAVKKRVSKRSSPKTKKVSRKSSSKKAVSSASITSRSATTSRPSTKKKSVKKKPVKKKAAPRRKCVSDEISLKKDGTEQFKTSNELLEAIPNYGGRPRKHSIAMENRICGFISMGYSLNKVCLYSDMPAIPTVLAWLNDKDKEGFSDKYAHAREMQTEILEDQIVDIADDAAQPLILKGELVLIDDKPIMVVDNASVQHARLRIDTRTRHMEVTKPKKWGRNVDLGQGVGGLLELMDLASARLADFKEKERQKALIDNDTGKVVES